MLKLVGYVLSQNMESKEVQDLQLLRNKIDEIDDGIISLLKKRMGIINDVSHLKRNNNESFFIKSAREADMIKALVAKVGDSIPHSIVINLWRKIISVANVKEQDLKIAIHNPYSISDYTYLVREYYGDIVPTYLFDSSTNIVSEMERGEIQIGIFALPGNESDFHNRKGDANENWWMGLANNKSGLKIFAKIPFVEFQSEDKSHNQIQLVAVAQKEPERSKEDVTLFYVEVEKETSRGQILSALKENNLQARILKSTKLNQVEGIVFYLIEIDGFYLEDDDAVRSFFKSKIKPYGKIIGHYATPILIKKDQYIQSRLKPEPL